MGRLNSGLLYFSSLISSSLACLMLPWNLPPPSRKPELEVRSVSKRLIWILSGNWGATFPLYTPSSTPNLVLKMT